MEHEPREGAYQPAEIQPEQANGQNIASEYISQEPGTETGELQPVEIQDPALPPRELTERDQRLTELLRLLYQTHTLQTELIDAAIASTSQEPQLLTPGQAVERYDPLKDIDPPFVDRYLRASLLTEAAVHIMRGSFTGYPVEPAYLRGALNPALAYYGYEVVEGQAPKLSAAETFTPFYDAEPSDEEYEDRLWNQEKTYDKSRRRLFSCEEGPANQKPKGIPDNLVYIYGSGAGGALADHAEVQRMVGILEKVEILREAMPYAGFGLDKSEFTPDADTPAGLEETWQYRYKYAREILGSVHDVLTEGFNAHDYTGEGDRVKLAALVFDLNEALREANLRIEVLPNWQPGQRLSLPGMMKVSEGLVKIKEVNDQEGDYQPAAPEEGAAEKNPSPADELTAVNQREEAVWKEREEHGGQLSPEWYFLHTKRRILQRMVEKDGTPATTKEIKENLARTQEEARYNQNERAFQEARAVRWAYLTYALPHDQELLEDWTAIPLSKEYNMMQREAMQQAGEPVEEIILNAEQSKTLAWMLEHAAIPHQVKAAETHVSLAPLEELLREATAAPLTLKELSEQRNHQEN